jgi:maspardin
VAQLFCQLRPQRCSSLFLVNSFCDLPSRVFLPPLSLLPSFLVSSTFLEGVPLDRDSRNLEACLFVKRSASELSAVQQGARLALISGGSPLEPIRLRERFQHDERITIVESWDDGNSQLSEQQKAQLAKFYPEALLAHVKRGGTFPMLANADEINLHLQVHMRRNKLPATAVQK